MSSHSLMFFAALSTVAKTREQPKCPPLDEWEGKCSVYVQWNIDQPQKGRKLKLFDMDGP